VTSGAVSRLLGRLGTRTAGHGVQMFFGAMILWVVGVFLLITFQPQDGAESTAALQAAVQSSVTGQDPDGFDRLFADGTVGDDYPATMLTRLADAGTGSWSTEIRAVGERRELIVVGASGCIGWMLIRTDDRWFLDGVPALSSPCRP
jgi:hypothetical protein